MQESDKTYLFNRNKKIIQTILKGIEKKCPESIDLIGIYGSFCNGDYHLKSDLDLLIIRNSDDAKLLDKCIIFDNVGFDINTKSWDEIKSLSEYSTPFVAQLFNLGIVYFRNQEVLNKIKNIQKKLIQNMNNTDILEESIRMHFKKALESFDYLSSSDDKTDILLYYSRIIKELESVIYFLNKKYVTKSINNIPLEINNMKTIPNGFLDTYKNITDFNNRDDIIKKSLTIIGIIQLYLDSFMIISEYTYEGEKVVEKEKITKDVLKGTYEEIFSNFRNKMFHAIDINSQYLSFMAMSGAQEFYDEITNNYDVPRVNLLDKYNPKDLLENKDSFENCLSIWEKIYSENDLKIEKYNSYEELQYMYSDEKPVIKPH